MTSNVRVVMDTNVVVSAVLLPRSVPRQAFDRALEHGTVLIASATMAELNDVLRRPHFDKYVHEDERLAFLATLGRDAALVVVQETDRKTGGAVMSPRLTQLLAEMTPQEQTEVEAFAAFLIVRRQLQHPQLLTDDIAVQELTELVAASGSFDWLNAEEEDLYSLADGEAVQWPSP